MVAEELRDQDEDVRIGHMTVWLLSLVLYRFVFIWCWESR